MLDEIRFWMQVTGDAKRTIICSPENESRIKGWIDARDMGGILTVYVNRFCPDDRVVRHRRPCPQRRPRPVCSPAVRVRNGVIGPDRREIIVEPLPEQVPSDAPAVPAEPEPAR